MHSRQLGASGLRVSAVSLGSWLTFGESVDPSATVDLVRRAFDLGVTLFDTADVYANGAAESALGRALHELPRAHVVIATKCFFPASERPNDRGLSRKHITESVEASLRRLGTDYLDLFLLHDDDGRTPAAEIAESMDRLVRAGKIRYWGLSNFKAGKVEQYAGLAGKEIRSRIAGTEDYFHIAAGLRMPTKLLEVIGSRGRGILAFSPQDCGRLSPGRKENSAYGSLIGTLDEVAAELETTRPRVLIAWSLAHPAVTSVLGGAESEAHVDDNIGGVALKIPRELMARLNQASQAHTVRRRAREAGRGRP